MDDAVWIINLIIVVAGLTMSILGLMQAFIERNIESNTRGFFLVLFSALSLYMICILTRTLVTYNDDYISVMLSRIVMPGQAILASVLVILSTAFLLYQSGVIKWYRSVSFIVAFLLWISYIILQIYNLFSGVLFVVNDDNSYYRGPLYPFQMIPMAIILSINLLIVFLQRDRLSKSQKTAFIIYAVLPIIAMLIQAIFKGIHLIAISTVISAFLMLSYITREQNKRYHIKELENADLKMNIMLSQIQTHFLYNALTTIKRLCIKDSYKASESIGQFAEYLRHNMDSITAKHPISFTKELDHVKGYLSLIELRFGDDIQVNYDIEYTDFRLPTLTLQPIVENAVTHGIRGTEDGIGAVTISTRLVGENVEVTVEDDGAGFDVNKTIDKDSHIGINNVRKRIEHMSGGELIIDSEIGHGTKATIRLKVD